MSSKRALVLVGCLASLVAAGCSASPPPVLTPLKEIRPKIPVVYVPGSTGSELRHRETGTIVWGRGRQMVSPRDGGYALARPIHFSPSSAQSRLKATRAIEKLRLAGVFTQEVYGPILELLAANGYRRGDLTAPAADADAFLFAYDWRLDHRLAAVRLREQLEALRSARGEERLAVDLICQSNGAYICRYLLKYGGATLEQAEAGVAGPPPRLDVRKLILLGNSNGGSLRMLREIHRGRSYIALIGRKIQPEVLFALPAMFQDLPVVREDLFLDARGEPLDVDLFDAESWRRYGWSVFAPEARRRLAAGGNAELFGDGDEPRLEYLRAALDYARRFHEVLRRDVSGFGATRYYMLQSNSRDTPDRAVLVRDGDGWRTLFTGDGELEKMGAVQALATAQGDGHGTVASQMWLSPQESAALAAEPFYVDDEHFELILRPETHRRLLDYLLDGRAAAPKPQ